MTMFFSVKKPLEINGRRYTPCVCYEIDDSLRSKLVYLAGNGLASLYNERVYFQNGHRIDANGKSPVRKGKRA